MKPANRTFIISGGVSGLGLATARNLCSEGAYVSLLDLNSTAGEEIIKELGERARFFETDVADTESITVAVKRTVEWSKQTGAAIGGVVAGAGVGLPGLVSCFIGSLIQSRNISGPLERYSIEEFFKGSMLI